MQYRTAENNDIIVAGSLRLMADGSYREVPEEVVNTPYCGGIVLIPVKMESRPDWNFITSYRFPA